MVVIYFDRYSHSLERWDSRLSRYLFGVAGSHGGCGSAGEAMPSFECGGRLSALLITCLHIDFDSDVKVS
jgi:hypothetical protein